MEPTKQEDQLQAQATPDNESTNSAVVRRRFLKAGATIAPVALSLTSRPVLAWHCKSPSAWGSEQLNPKSSLQAGKIGLADESWTITNWGDNSTRAGLPLPWDTLKKAVNSSQTVTNFRNSYTIASLYAGLTIPSGLTGTQKVKDVIKTGSQFHKYLVVARLNFKLIGNVSKCLTHDGVDQLNLMANGVYQPLPNKTWHSQDIQSYLYNNWVVRP